MTSFEDLYNTYFKRVYAYIFSRVRNHATTEDLCAAAWKNAYEHWASFDEQKGEFTQWIFTIARNQTNMYWRLYWVKNVFSLTEESAPVYAGDSPLKNLEQDTFRRDLTNALGKLSARERDILALKFYSGLNNRQIAQVSQLSESNVGTIINRAVTKMRKRMKNYD